MVLILEVVVMVMDGLKVRASAGAKRVRAESLIKKWMYRGRDQRQANEDSTSLKDGMGMGDFGFHGHGGWNVELDDDIICFRYDTI
jgi:hypothetical protein